MDNNGTNLQRLTNHSSEDVGADWSPDGQSIAFVSNRNGNYQIYTMDTSGTSIQQITTLAGDNIQPDWKPVFSATSAIPDKNHPSTLPDFRLDQNYPNPFNTKTVIRYHLPEKSHIRIQISDMTGKSVSDLIDRYQPAGTYEIHWNAHTSGSGIYLLRMETAGRIYTRKCLLIK